MHLFQLSMAWRFLGIVILNHMWSKHSKLLYYFIFQVWIFGHLFFSCILDVDQSLSFCRYDQTNQGIQSHVMQHIISSEVNGEHVLSLKKLLFKNRKLTRSLRYFNFLFFFQLSYLLINFLISIFYYFFTRSFIFAFTNRFLFFSIVGQWYMSTSLCSFSVQYGECCSKFADHGIHLYNYWVKEVS
jgi:hypothetical protein